MDEQKKREAAEALKNAESKASEARSKANTAKAEAEGGSDEDRKKADEAEQAAQAAEKARVDAKAALDALSDSGDVDDLVDDATGDRSKLKDGTDPNKEIRVPFEKFKELNEQAKLFQQFSPVLAKLQKDPTLIDKLMAGDDPNKSIAERLKALEDREATAKRTEVKDVISNAIKVWPDFRSRWEEVKPIIAGLEASGLAYAEAVQRAYFAVNPDAAKKPERLIAQENARSIERNRGSMGPLGGGGGNFRSEGGGEEYDMSDADKEFVQKRASIRSSIQNTRIV